MAVTPSRPHIIAPGETDRPLRPADEAYDTGTRNSDIPPPHPFLVCATPRTGTNLLCSGIESAGLVGPCFEYLNAENRVPLERRWGCDGSLGSYMRGLYGRRTTESGFLGLKMHWDQVPSLLAEALGTPDAEPEFGVSADCLQRLFPGAAFIRVLRVDVNRQAISLWLAFVTDIWREYADGVMPARRAPVREPFYSFEGIERCRRAIENAEVHWDRFFRANGIEPLTIEYERLVDDFEATVREAIAHISPGSEVARVPPSPMRRQSGELTDEILERYARDRERHPLPSPVELLESSR